ncbi:ABC transporter permease [Vibrio sp. 10N.286.49.C2]|uniref:ABC transporter permease n=1 Tax=unclassified Vibrio TaxID=2614977 RepID=UPI000C827536|nr:MULTISPECIES: ABC transporter permease [unclassified Vibrio]PMH34765.1 ABC transporter permease [Vibrio sp. 10N.286.49.C2]PMH51446.1 ABC transporter permease [Vibrio sp. 10N.286.49.B1]PMH79358.1 ABC transporter permease [Vibrio sp. 10N.286.48.B7]
MAGESVNKRLLLWSVDEIRQGQLWPIALSLTMIIACIFGLAALAERMEQVIVKQGKDALSADTIYISANPILDDNLTLIKQSGLEASYYTRFATMSFSDVGMQLITVKAVDDAFPLRGSLTLASKNHQQHHVAPGELWLDERIAEQLNVVEGDVVTVGDADLTVSGVIVEEPGISFNPFQQMPTAYIHQDSVDETGAVQLGSRVQFRVYLAGDDDAIQGLKTDIALSPSDRWRDQDSASRSNDIFERTTQYLSLTVAIIIIMAATTLVLTCQNYVQSRRKTVAMLKSLGASKRWVIRWLTIQALLLVTMAIVVGIVLGVGLEYLLRIPLTDLLPSPLPSYGAMPAIIAITSSLLIGIPALGIPLYKLVSVSSVEVLQSVDEKRGGWIYLLIAVPLIPLVVVYQNNTLIWILLAGIAGLFLLLGGVSVVFTLLLSRVTLPVSLKLAVSRINRSKRHTALQYGALGLSLMLLTTIWLVRTDLLSDWQRTLPADAPNAFALNIAEHEIEPYLEVLDSHSVQRSQAFPITRGRLTLINGQDAELSQKKGDVETDALSRELNFTYASALPDYNDVLEGQWTSVGGVSVEQQVAENLNINIGDELGFTINGQSVSATVNSIRFVEWRDMKPNFYFIFTPDVMENIPSAWLVSFRIEDKDNELVSSLSRQYSTVSLMDIRLMGDKIQSLLSQIVWSITVLAALGVLAGVLLIFTLLRLSLAQRRDELRLYRTLGASRQRIVRTIWAEYGIMALIAGLVATLGAEIVVGLIMKLGFELPWNWHFSTWVAVPVIAFITLAAVLFSLIRQMLSPNNNGIS